jgi:transcriptional regulator with XRE-family HTH domain
MKNDIHIGELIKEIMKKQNVTQRELAQKLGCTEANVSKILRKSSLNTTQLLDISRILRHDFFQYYSAYYKAVTL